ncbi:hypothetical protein ACFL5Q_04900 [Planctomycetota bacterium]
MSLLEVLISIFVLSIGLLAVAAVIPVGRYAIVEAAKSDRAAACGQAVLNDVKVRRMINPGNWGRADGQAISQQRPWCWGDTTPAPPAAQTHVRESGYPLGESYAIDSFNVAGKPLNDRQQLTHFPYNIRNLGFPILPGRVWGWTRMRRVTWNGVGLNQLLASGVFGWHDDLRIPVPGDETQRPRQMFVNRSVSGAVEGRAFPFMAGDGGPVRNPLQGQDSGDYSWMVTVTPVAERHDFVYPNDTGSIPDLRYPYNYSRNAPVYDVSVVVFYKRDTPPPSDYESGGVREDETPSERQVELMFIGTGLGGGDVLLFTLHRNPADITTARDRRDYLDIKENEWLMVSGRYWYLYEYYLQDGTRLSPDPNDPDYEDPLISTSTRVPVGVHKWYRVVTAGETVSEDFNNNGVLDPGEDLNNSGSIDWYREATLAGPDWNPEWAVDLHCPPGVPPRPLHTNKAFATLLSGAIGVYSTTVELEW